MRLDLDALRRWVGRSEEAEELLTPALAGRFAATLQLNGIGLRAGDPAPIGIHWCIGPPALPAAGLGPDGHPALGGFLPPVPSARRMWAGGVIRTRRSLRIGAMAQRRSRVVSVSVKEGRSGRLCFVAVDHDYLEQGEVVVSERQDIVYRVPSTQDGRRPLDPVPVRDLQPGPAFETNSTLLFRYSALTFNGHRIHYDLPYARDVEGYDGLVVHGPLQATWLLHEAARRMGNIPCTFAFRGVMPLICGDIARIATKRDGGQLLLRVLNGRGATTMTAEAS